MVGIGYTVYVTANWASIPYVVEPHTQGTAFGISTALQNIGLMFAPLFVASIIENTTRDYGYFWVNIVFVFINVVGLGLNYYLYYVDTRYYNS
jgi:MFS family permease